MKVLLDAGANTEIKDRIGGTRSSGTTPLHTAVHYNLYDIAKLLLDAGANMNAKDKNGETPLDLAAGKSSTKYIELLESYRPKKRRKLKGGLTFKQIKNTIRHNEILAGGKRDIEARRNLNHLIGMCSDNFGLFTTS